jgi:mannose-6-phosphate isomerase-like protein (cupin superfamily)
MSFGKWEIFGRLVPTFRSFGFAYGFIYLIHRFAVAGIDDPGSADTNQGYSSIRFLVELKCQIDWPYHENKIRSFGSSALALLALTSLRAQTTEPTAATSDGPIFKNVSDLKWDKIIPDLGENSPEICFLRVDPKTHATSLLIRTSKAIHVRKHWHTANESHTMISGKAMLACEGKRAELSPGGFNYMPAKMVHEAWLPANSLTDITVDGPWDVNWVEGPPTAADLTK